MRFLQFPDRSFYQTLNECIADMEVTEFSISDVLALYIVAVSLSYFRPFLKMSPALKADTFLFTAYIARIFAFQRVADDESQYSENLILINGEIEKHVFPKIEKFIRNRYAAKTPFPDTFVHNRFNIFTRWFQKSIEQFFRAMIFFIYSDSRKKDFPLYVEVEMLRENTKFFKAMLKEVHTYYFQLEMSLRDVIDDFVSQTISKQSRNSRPS